MPPCLPKCGAARRRTSGKRQGLTLAVRGLDTRMRGWAFWDARNAANFASLSSGRAEPRIEQVGMQLALPTTRHPDEITAQLQVRRHTNDRIADKRRPSK